MKLFKIIKGSVLGGLFNICNLTSGTWKLSKMKLLLVSQISKFLCQFYLKPYFFQFVLVSLAIIALTLAEPNPGHGFRTYKGYSKGLRFGGSLNKKRFGSHRGSFRGNLDRSSYNRGHHGSYKTSFKHSFVKSHIPHIHHH